MSEIYNRIRMRRQELGWTTDELAKRMGYKDRSSISKIESGKADIPQSNVRVSVILKKNGQVIGGTYTYANNVKGNGGSAPFVIYSFVDYDSFEVVAAEW